MSNNWIFSEYDRSQRTAGQLLVVEAMASGIPSEIALAEEMLETAERAMVMRCFCCKQAIRDGEHTCGCESGSCRVCFPPCTDPDGGEHAWGFDNRCYYCGERWPAFA